jgi:hypothetical protein
VDAILTGRTDSAAGRGGTSATPTGGVTRRSNRSARDFPSGHSGPAMGPSACEFNDLKFCLHSFSESPTTAELAAQSRENAVCCFASPSFGENKRLNQPANGTAAGRFDVWTCLILT